MQRQDILEPKHIFEKWFILSNKETEAVNGKCVNWFLLIVVTVNIVQKL